MMAHGTPMVQMGDECGRTQGGNNNAYNQDNATSWFDWERAAEFADLERFCAELVALRHRHPVLAQPDWWGDDVRFFGAGGGLDDSSGSRSLAWSVGDLYVIANAWWEPLRWSILAGRPWRRVVDTSLPSPDDIVPAGVPVDGHGLRRRPPLRRHPRTPPLTHPSVRASECWQARTDTRGHSDGSAVGDDLDAGDDEDAVALVDPLAASRRRGRPARPRVDRPYSTAWVANADWRTRSAHMPPHQARPAASANVQFELVTVTSLNPPARTQAARWRPASASARLRVVSWWYSSSQRSRRGFAGAQKNAA